MITRSIRVGLVVVALLAVSVATAPGSQAATAGGFNDFSCAPSPHHPNPVVLIHGLGAPGGEANFATMGPALAADGYCAFAISYGHTDPLQFLGGFAPMEQSAEVIYEYILRVLDATGAAEVDIVGHSEGGFHSLYVPKRFALGDSVGAVVAIAPPTHGTDISGTLTLARALGLPPLAKPITALLGCAACDNLAIDEDIVHKLNDGPIAQTGIDYTVIASRMDLIVTPIETSFVREPGVTNIVVQDVCPTDFVGHIGLVFDPGVYDMVTNALDPAGATPVECGWGPPF